MDILDILLDILLKPPQPFIGLFFNFRLDDMSICYPLSGCNVIHFHDTVFSQPFWFYIITHLSSFSSNFPSPSNFSSPLVSHYLYFTSFAIFIGSYSTSTTHFAPVASGVVDLPHCLFPHKNV